MLRRSKFQGGREKGEVTEANSVNHWVGEGGGSGHPSLWPVARARLRGPGPSCGRQRSIAQKKPSGSTPSLPRTFRPPCLLPSSQKPSNAPRPQPGRNASSRPHLFSQTSITKGVSFFQKKSYYPEPPRRSELGLPRHPRRPGGRPLSLPVSSAPRLASPRLLLDDCLPSCLFSPTGQPVHSLPLPPTRSSGAPTPKL